MSKALTILNMYLKVLEEDLCEKCKKKPSVQKLKEKLDAQAKEWFRDTFIDED